ncbi:MAG: hypothetical protein UV63_C0036G0010 [Microgenomates group bacterium GW2011_GWC1_43_11]|nr:MAG: hypothetical protein UV63_C0036G0010 [Microgenomates group bacterium GW2011_GWC1_43_11]HCM81866.1 hypothetical protein [Patescibacteria group bacterium]
MALCTRECPFCPGEEAQGRILRIRESIAQGVWSPEFPTELEVSFSPPNDEGPAFEDPVFGQVNSVTMKNAEQSNGVTCYINGNEVHILWPLHGEKRFLHDEGIWDIPG